MVVRKPLLTLIGAAALLVAGCGGTSSGATPGSGGATPTAGGTTSAPEVTTNPSGGEATPRTGGGTVKACDLLTADEVMAATQQTGVTASIVAASDTEGLSACGYVANGTVPVVILTILDPTNTNTDPAGYLHLPGSVEVPVNGARAIFVSAVGGVTFVFKGNTVATIQVIVPAPGDDQQKTATKLLQHVADRLP
jgi:hypothetical protein